MKKISLLIALFSATVLNAQITVNSSDFISGADTVLLSVVTDFQNINYQSTGANFNWDFLNLPIDSQRVDTFYNTASAGFVYQFVFNNPFLSPNYQASYYRKADIGALPTGGLPIAIDNPITFTKISNSKFENVGLGANINNIPLPIQADTIDVVYEFPMTYQDNWTSNSYFFFDLNPGLNAQFKRFQNRSSVVDGYGTISTAFGTFECLRVASSITYIDSVFFDLFGTGGSWIPLPSPPVIEYRWIAKNNKIPILSINVSNSILGPEITLVELRDSKGVANLIPAALPSIAIFPNPANNMITIDGINNYNEITILNLNGKVVYSSTKHQNTQLVIDCSTWAKGVYLLNATSDEKTVTNKIVLQ